MVEKNGQAGIDDPFERAVWSWFGEVESDYANDGHLDVSLLRERLEDFGVVINVAVGNASNLLERDSGIS